MLIILYFTLHIYCFAESNVNKTTLSSDHPLSLRNLCPYSKFCQSSPLKEIPNELYEPCCEACSCESDCFETGSCCPDMPLSGLVEPRYPCRHLWHFGKDVGMFENGIGSYWHHVIDDCSDSEKALAYQRCHKPSAVQDFVMVTDTTTGKVYRNKHCAECNDVWSYVMLKLVVNCKDSLSLTDLSTNEERENYVMENCSLASFPPDKRMGVSYCIPDTRVMSTCNVTGTWDVYDKEIETRCVVNSYDQNKIFKTFSYSGVFYFANVYCFLCNVNSKVQRVDTCEILEDDKGSKSGIILFNFILDFESNVWGEGTILPEERACHSTYIWDPYTMTCRQLFCPAGHIPYFGRCKTLFSNIEGYALAVNFNVTINYGNITANAFLLRALENRLVREIGTDISCGICRSTIYAEKNSTSQMVFRFEVFANEKCLYNILLERIRQMAIRKNVYLQLSYGTQKVRIALVIIFGEIDVKTSSKDLSKVSAFCSRIESIDETILLYCPSIKLTENETTEFGLNNLQVVKDPNAKAQKMCIDEYFSAKQQNTAAAIGHCFILYYLHLIATVVCVYS